MYNVARKFNCNKIALGHHRDDCIQTFLLNSFFAGKIAAMPAIYKIKAGDLDVIRPLILCPESTIKKFSEENNFPVIPCNLCGSQEGLKRQAMETLLVDLEKKYPHIRHSISSSLKNVQNNMLL